MPTNVLAKGLATSVLRKQRTLKCWIASRKRFKASIMRHASNVKHFATGATTQSVVTLARAQAAMMAMEPSAVVAVRLLR